MDKAANPTILEHHLLIICMVAFQRTVCPIGIGGGRKSSYAINNDTGRPGTNLINHSKQTYRCMSHVCVSSGLLATVNSDSSSNVVEAALKAVIKLHPDGDTLDKELLTPSCAQKLGRVPVANCHESISIAIVHEPNVDDRFHCSLRQHDKYAKYSRSIHPAEFAAAYRMKCIPAEPTTRDSCCNRTHSFRDSEPKDWWGLTNPDTCESNAQGWRPEHFSLASQYSLAQSWWFVRGIIRHRLHTNTLIQNMFLRILSVQSAKSVPRKTIRLVRGIYIYIYILEEYIYIYICRVRIATTGSK